jgi:hypothetical protein
VNILGTSVAERYFFVIFTASTPAPPAGRMTHSERAPMILKKNNKGSYDLVRK